MNENSTGKLAEILQSGIAPGFLQKGRLDPRGAQAKALRGLKAVENEPLYKHGPTRGARAIEKYFGLGDSTAIKKAWERPFRKRRPVLDMGCIALWIGLGAILMLGTCQSVKAGYITPGETYIDGQLIHAADLNNGIGNATIGSGFISSQPINNSPLNSDYFIEFSPTLNGLYKVSFSSVINNASSWTSLSQGIPNINTNDLFQFFNQASGAPNSIQFTNLMLTISSNLEFQYVNFAPTNQNNTGATNKFILTSAGSTWQPTSTNQQPYFPAYTNNGVPYQMSYSTLVDNASSLINTNQLGWDYTHFFQPWTLYGTNPISPYTNALGYTTNELITNLTMVTASGGTAIALSDTDTVPINAYSMGANGTVTSTNTGATLGALFQYFTNKNGLPPYTQGREQFNGTPVSLVVCNTPASGYIGPSGNANVIAVTTNMITFNPLITNNIFAFTLITNGNTMFQGTGGVDTTNVVYWGVPFLTSTWLLQTNVMFVNVYTNYVSAVANGISQSGAPIYSANFGTGNKILIVTNLTSFNGDVAPATTPGAPPTVTTGVYLFGFRTNSLTSFFYVTGSTVGSGGGAHPGGILTLPGLGYPSTSQFQFGTYDAVAGAYETWPISQILVQPQ